MFQPTRPHNNGHTQHCGAGQTVLRGKVGGDMQLRPKPHPNTSPDRPGLPDFSASNIENTGWPGYETRHPSSFIKVTDYRYNEGRKVMLPVV